MAIGVGSAPGRVADSDTGALISLGAVSYLEYCQTLCSNPFSRGEGSMSGAPAKWRGFSGDYRGRPDMNRQKLEKGAEASECAGLFLGVTGTGRESYRADALSSGYRIA